MNTVYLFTPGRGGGELNQREGERGNTGEYPSWVENTNMTESTQDTGYLQSINYNRHLFLDDVIVALYLRSLVFSASTLIKKENFPHI